VQNSTAMEGWLLAATEKKGWPPTHLALRAPACQSTAYLGQKPVYPYGGYRVIEGIRGKPSGKGYRQGTGRLNKGDHAHKRVASAGPRMNFGPVPGALLLLRPLLKGTHTHTHTHTNSAYS
jgi:hypothetical protein